MGEAVVKGEVAQHIHRQHVGVGRKIGQVKIGEISCCAGATSLWVQWIEIPSSHIFSRALRHVAVHARR